MLVRHIVIPTSPAQLWDALTDPAALASWFGSQVEWDLRPGGAARFLDDDGSLRRGIVDSVLPGRHLSFRWWRSSDGDDGEEGASQVTYTLDPDTDGTRLTVTEQPVPVPPAAGALACASVDPSFSGMWSRWDSRLFSCWAQATGALVARSRA